ncbi:hypothetical protein EDB80DRAFT_874299 [Ilyonectria destructans]|nr:hypothetical protein EDB80DRAFT_874299 [Ilyonectria destructans]
MLDGDLMDLNSLLKFIQSPIDSPYLDDEFAHAFSRRTRTLLMAVAQRLCEAFNDVVTTHRQEFGIDRTDRDCDEQLEQYRDEVASRRTIIALQYPAPAVTAQLVAIWHT